MKVIFEYDENEKKWEAIANGAVSEKEARQAFSAVVLTCQQLDGRLLVYTKTQVIDSFNIRIIPAVR